MGLFSILRKAKLREKEMRLLLLGLDNAGKTSLLRAFSGESIEGVAPTLGFNIKTVSYSGFQLNLWDVGGQKTLRFSSS